jgi:O-antigen/teichoic acid export membrane protein
MKQNEEWLLKAYNDIESAKLLISGSKKITDTAIKGILLILIPVTLILIYFSKEIIMLLYNEYYMSASLFLMPFILGTFIFVLSLIFLTVLYAAGYPKLRLGIILFPAFLNLLLCYIGVIYYEPTSVSWAFLITQTIILIVSFFYYHKISKALEIGLYIKPILGFVPFFIALAYTPDTNIINKITIIFVSLLVSVGLQYYIKTIDKDDFNLIKMIFQKK